MPPADEAAGESEEGFVDVVASVGADEQPAAVVQPGEGSFDDPAVTTEPGAVLGLAAGDDRSDAALPEEPAVRVVVVRAVGDQRPRSASRTSDPTTDGRHPVEQVEQLGDVVAVAAGERGGERRTTAAGDQDASMDVIHEEAGLRQGHGLRGVGRLAAGGGWGGCGDAPVIDPAARGGQSAMRGSGAQSSVAAVAFWRGQTFIRARPSGAKG
jgi:hypothetical protein